jgi:hypothetical protein
MCGVHNSIRRPARVQRIVGKLCEAPEEATMKKPAIVTWATLLLLLLAAPMVASSQSHEGYVAVGGGSLFYLSEGSGPAVVLLHGYPRGAYVG